jgi:hypothetical protein
MSVDTVVRMRYWESTTWQKESHWTNDGAFEVNLLARFAKHNQDIMGVCQQLM